MSHIFSRVSFSTKKHVQVCKVNLMVIMGLVFRLLKSHQNLIEDAYHFFFLKKWLIVRRSIFTVSPTY